MENAVLKMRFDGSKIYFNDGKIVNDRVQVKISYLTALLYLDGNNVCSFYPQNLTEEIVADVIRDYCRDYNVEISREELIAVAEYIKRCI